MKKHQTAKYKKRKKKELANRKAKEQATQQTVVVEKPSAIGTSPEAVKRLLDAKPISPARRAFQDV